MNKKVNSAGADSCELRRLLTAAGFDPYVGHPGNCVFDEQVITALNAFQRSVGLPERAAITPEVVRVLRDRAGRR